MTTDRRDYAGDVSRPGTNADLHLVERRGLQEQPRLVETGRTIGKVVVAN